MANNSFYTQLALEKQSNIVLNSGIEGQVISEQEIPRCTKMNNGKNSIPHVFKYDCSLKIVLGTVGVTIIRNIQLYPQRTDQQWGDKLQENNYYIRHIVKC